MSETDWKRPLAGVPRRLACLGRAALVLGAAVLASATMPGGAQAQSGAEPVKIGVMGPFTGPVSRTGQDIKKGAEMALEDARKSGLVPLTIDGQKRDVDLVWVDSESSPEKAVRAVSDAINRQGVKFMVSGWHSSVAMAVMDVEADAGIVHEGHGGESQYICEKINKDPERYAGWFKGWPSPPIFAGLYGDPLQHFMDEGLWKPKTKKAAIVVEDTDYGRGWGEALKSSLEKIGFNVISTDIIALDETEFTPVLAKYKALGVSVVGMTVTGNVSASNFVKQYQQERVPALLIGHGLTWFGEWYQLTGDASNYVVTMDSPRVIAPEQKEWLDRYKKKYNEDPSLAAAGQQGYDYMMVGLNMLKNAGSLDKDKLIKAGHDIDYQGVWQHYNFAEEKSDRALCPGEVMIGPFGEGFFFPLVQLMDGEPKILWPLKYAEGKFQPSPAIAGQ